MGEGFRLDLYSACELERDEKQLSGRVNSTVAEQHAARLVFAGGAFNPTLDQRDAAPL